MTNGRTIWLFALAVLTLGGAIMFLNLPTLAGPLDPPDGPVEPTGPSLADLAGAISGIGQDQGMAFTPGSSTDAWPKPTDGQPLVELRVDGAPLGFWRIVDIGHSRDVIMQQVIGPDGQPMTIPLPGNEGVPSVTLVRSVTEDMGAWNFYQQTADGSPPSDISLRLFTIEFTPYAEYQFSDAFASAYDMRHVNSQPLEQLMIVGRALERVEP